MGAGNRGGGRLTAESDQKGLAPDSWHVAECGKCDTGLAAARLIQAETDQTTGLPRDPRQPAQGQARAASKRPTAHSHDLTRPSGDSPRVIGDGVMTDDGVVTEWTRPLVSRLGRRRGRWRRARDSMASGDLRMRRDAGTLGRDPRTPTLRPGPLMSESDVLRQSRGSSVLSSRPWRWRRRPRRRAGSATRLQPGHPS